MLARQRWLSIPCLLVCVLTLAACGTSAHDAVKAKVEQYARAVRDHDYKAICSQVLAQALVARLNSYGVGCQQAMRIAYSSVQNAAIGVGKVTVTGKTAAVITLSLAANQSSSLDTILLVDTAHGWRISSVHTAVAATGG